MISGISVANAASTSPSLLMPRASKPSASAPAPVLSPGDPREASRAMRKEMASRRMQGVTDRMKTLKLMIKIDPRSALKLAAELAKELKAAVKAYQDAGGRNVSSGDLAIIRRQIADARQAQSDTAAASAQHAVPVTADQTTLNADADIRRAQQAYAGASNVEPQGRSIARLEAIEAIAVADNGFFGMVKGLVAGLKKAREDIRHESHAARHPPDEDDWKDADKAQVDLERQIDTASTGISVSV